MGRGPRQPPEGFAAGLQAPGERIRVGDHDELVGPVVVPDPGEEDADLRPVVETPDLSRGEAELVPGEIVEPCLDEQRRAFDRLLVDPAGPLGERSVRCGEAFGPTPESLSGPPAVVGEREVPGQGFELSALGRDFARLARRAGAPVGRPQRRDRIVGLLGQRREGRARVPPGLRLELGPALAPERLTHPLRVGLVGRRTTERVDRAIHLPAILVERPSEIEGPARELAVVPLCDPRERFERSVDVAAPREAARAPEARLEVGQERPEGLRRPFVLALAEERPSPPHLREPRLCGIERLGDRGVVEAKRLLRMTRRECRLRSLEDDRTGEQRRRNLLRRHRDVPDVPVEEHEWIDARLEAARPLARFDDRELDRLAHGPFFRAGGLEDRLPGELGAARVPRQGEGFPAKHTQRRAQGIAPGRRRIVESRRGDLHGLVPASFGEQDPNAKQLRVAGERFRGTHVGEGRTRPRDPPRLEVGPRHAERLRARALGRREGCQGVRPTGPLVERTGDRARREQRKNEAREPGETASPSPPIRPSCSAHRLPTPPPRSFVQD